MNSIIQIKDDSSNSLFPRTSIYNPKYTDAACKTAFVSRMNAKAADIGMSSTTFINPSGLGESGSYSSITVRDMARMCVAGLSYNELCHVWSASSHTVKIKGKSSVSIQSSFQNNSYLSNYYDVLGGKTGAGDGYYTLTIATVIDGIGVVGAIAQASSNDGRFQAMKQLFDVAKTVLEGGTPTSNPVSSANCACAVKIPLYNTASLGDTPLDILYEKNATTSTPPMSTTKIMTAMVFLDYVRSISPSVTLTEHDFSDTPTQYLFSQGDVVTIEDLFYAMMLQSSNQAANAFGRVGGNVILQTDAFELL